MRITSPPVARSLPTRLFSALCGLWALGLLCGLLPSRAQGQMALLPRPGIPTMQAAKQWEAKKPRPIEKVLVKLKAGVHPKLFAKMFSAQMAQKVPMVRQNAERTAPALAYKRSNNAIGWHVFRLGQASDLPYTLEELKKHPMVEKAEPDYHLKLLDIPEPSDYYWNQEDWEHLIVVLSTLASSRGEARQLDSSYWPYTWSIQQVNSLAAWDVYPGYYPTAQDRIDLLNSDPARLPLVAVIDSGLDMNHPDLATTPTNADTSNQTDVNDGGQIQSDLARSFVLGEQSDDATDEFGHGTSVTGIIAAAPNNVHAQRPQNSGIVGLGFPSRIVPIKVIDGNGNGDDSDLIDAMTFAVDNGCLLINASLTTDTVQFPQALQDAVDYAWNKGTLVVAGAGNDGTTDGLNAVPLLADTRRYPAACVHALAVSATSYGGLEPSDFSLNGYPYGGETKANYSNANTAVGISAPGGNISTFQNFADEGVQFGLDPLQQYVLVWTLAPTYEVALTDPFGPYGSYAQVGLYLGRFGMIQGTSFSCPHVTALAALYAAKNGLTQAPGVPQQLINAIQRGAMNMNGRADGGWDKNFGYGRMDAYTTLLDLNARNTTVGGFIGQVTVGGTVVNNITVTARKPGSTKRYTAVTFPDGIYHMVNVPEGEYVVTTSAFGYSGSKTVTVKAGCDVHGVNFPLGPPPDISVAVTPANPILFYGSEQQFEATVTGTDQSEVLWSLPVDSGATINSNGLLYAPLSKMGSHQAIVKATSLADTTRFGQTVVTFQPRSVLPVADAYVRAGSTANSNFGSEAMLMTKYAAQWSNGMNRIMYLKFDLTDLALTPVTSTLTLTLRNPSGPTNRNLNLNVYQVNDVNWSETGITYNNAPGLNPSTCTTTGTFVTSKAANLVIGDKVEFDLTAFIASNLGKKVTLQILCDLQADTGYNAVFTSRESPANKPILSFTY